MAFAGAAAGLLFSFLLRGGSRALREAARRSARAALRKARSQGGTIRRSNTNGAAEFIPGEEMFTTGQMAKIVGGNAWEFFIEEAGEEFGYYSLQHPVGQLLTARSLYQTLTGEEPENFNELLYSAYPFGTGDEVFAGMSITEIGMEFGMGPMMGLVDGPVWRAAGEFQSLIGLGVDRDDDGRADDAISRLQGRAPATRPLPQQVTHRHVRGVSSNYTIPAQRAAHNASEGAVMKTIPLLREVLYDAAPSRSGRTRNSIQISTSGKQKTTRVSPGQAVIPIPYSNFSVRVNLGTDYGKYVAGQEGGWFDRAVRAWESQAFSTANRTFHATYTDGVARSLLAGARTMDGVTNAAAQNYAAAAQELNETSPRNIAAYAEARRRARAAAEELVSASRQANTLRVQGAFARAHNANIRTVAASASAAPRDEAASPIVRYARHLNNKKQNRVRALLGLQGTDQSLNRRVRQARRIARIRKIFKLRFGVF